MVGMADAQAAFETAGKQVRVYPGPDGCPAVYLHAYLDDQGKIERLLRRNGCPAHSLVVITNLRWDDEMTPWDCPPLSEEDTPCHGQADSYLEWFSGTLMPQAEQYFAGPPAYRTIAGYSLAGLFALYSLYRTDIFSRAASVSGSLWYPRFLEFATSHALHCDPACLYLSLGDEESRTGDPILDTGQARTEALAKHFNNLGIPTTFELNEGDHYTNPEKRTARGIQWMLQQ